VTPDRLPWGRPLADDQGVAAALRHVSHAEAGSARGPLGRARLQTDEVRDSHHLDSNGSRDPHRS